MKKLWVVLGECGEYSERDVWVSGIFASEDAAQAKVIERSAVRRVYENWSQSSHKAVRDAGVQLAWKDDDPAWTIKKEIYARYEISKPEFERGERFEIIEINEGEWRT